MPLYSTNKPKLFNDNILQKLEETNDKVTGSYLSYVLNFFKYIYNFLDQNKLAIIFFLMIFILLYTRYYVKNYVNTINNTIQQQQQSQLQPQPIIMNKYKNNDTITSKNDDIITSKNDDTITSKNDDTITSLQSISNTNKENKSLFAELNDEYDELINNNTEIMSENMINDIYQNKKKKLSIDEATRIIVDGCG